MAQRRLAEYVSRGFCLIRPEELGVDPSVHKRALRETVRATQRIVLSGRRGWAFCS